VFIARVAYTAMEPVGGKLQWQIYGLNVDRVFLGHVDSSLTFTPGQKPTQQQIASADAHVGDVGYVGSSCDFQFKEGETYLVFARRTTDGRWTTSECDGTRPLSEATEHLAYLESIPELEAGGQIYGTVERTVADRARPHEAVAKPVANVTVVATAGSQRFTTTTDAEGKYEMRVPAGVYTIRPIVPDTVRVYRDRQTHLVAARGCALTNFGIVSDGRIEGRVVDTDGAPVPRICQRNSDRPACGLRWELLHRPIDAHRRKWDVQDGRGAARHISLGGKRTLGTETGLAVPHDILAWDTQPA
jgi:hypothetical protein